MFITATLHIWYYQNNVETIEKISRVRWVEIQKIG